MFFSISRGGRQFRRGVFSRGGAIFLFSSSLRKGTVCMYCSHSKREGNVSVNTSLRFFLLFHFISNLEFKILFTNCFHISITSLIVVRIVEVHIVKEGGKDDFESFPSIAYVETSEYDSNPLGSLS